MSVAYNPNIVLDKLVFCVDAGNVKSYSGSGTNYYDLIGSLDGTMQDVTVTGDGHFSFNGQSSNGSAVAFPNSLVAKNPSAFLGEGQGKLSYECWVNRQGVYEDSGEAARIMSTDASDYTAIVLTSSGSSTPNQVRFYADGAAKNITTTETLDLDTWYHIVGTFDMSQTVDNINIYINGELVKTGSYDDSTSTNSDNIQGTYGENTSKAFAIGSNTEAAVSYNHGFNGYIDICRIYGKALSAAEVKQNYQTNKERFGL